MFQEVGAFPFLMGIISGYPVGAKIVTNMRRQNLLTKEEAERLLAFTNNSGPLFIIGTIGITLFGNSTIGFLLLITHLLACFTVGIIFRFWKTNTMSSPYQSMDANIIKDSKYNILYDSIFNSIQTILLIGGFVVLFSSILSILNSSGILNLLTNFLKPIFRTFNINYTFCNSFVTGLIELTNGISQVSSIPCKSISTNIILCSFLLGFAGICVMLQVYSIISSSDISIKPYMLGKFLHGTISALYTYLIIKNVSFFNLDLELVYATTSSNACFFSNCFNQSNIFILCIIFALIFIFLIQRQKRKYCFQHTKVDKI